MYYPSLTRETRSAPETNQSNEPRHEISNNVECATSKGSDQPAHTRTYERLENSYPSLMRETRSAPETNQYNEPRHEISNNVVCATSKGSDQPAHTRGLIRAFARRLNIL